MTGTATEVLIVGAGPAGTALAWRLARRGVRVLIVDARAFPRSKPCGDAVSPGATPLMREMGLEPRLVRRASRLDGWRIRSPGGTWFEGRFSRSVTGSPPWGFAIARRDLDALLLEAACAAGAEFLERRRVYGLVELGGRVAGVIARGPDGSAETLFASFVVGADGLRSRVARLLGGVRRGRRRRLALVGRLGGVPDGQPLGELRLSADGVLGWAPIGPGRCNLTLVVDARHAPAIRPDPAGFFLARIRAYGAEARVGGGGLEGPPEATGPFELQPRRRSRSGALLVGDAAGYFDPFTGQGIYRALAGARLAAPAVEEALADPAGEAEALRRYERSLDHLLRPSRRVQRMIDAVVSRPRLIDPCARILAHSPGLAGLLVDLTGDRIAPQSLLRPHQLVGRLRRARGAARLVT